MKRATVFGIHGACSQFRTCETTNVEEFKKEQEIEPKKCFRCGGAALLESTAKDFVCLNCHLDLTTKLFTFVFVPLMWTNLLKRKQKFGQIFNENKWD